MLHASHCTCMCPTQPPLAGVRSASSCQAGCSKRRAEGGDAHKWRGSAGCGPQQANKRPARWWHGIADRIAQSSAGTTTICSTCLYMSLPACIWDHLRHAQPPQCTQYPNRDPLHADSTLVICDHSCQLAALKGPSGLPWIDNFKSAVAFIILFHSSSWGSLSLSLSLYLSIHLSIYLSISALSIYLSIHLSIYPSIYPSIHLSIYPSIHLSIHLSICCAFGPRSH